MRISLLLAINLVVVYNGDCWRRQLKHRSFWRAQQRDLISRSIDSDVQTYCDPQNGENWFCSNADDCLCVAAHNLTRTCPVPPDIICPPVSPCPLAPDCPSCPSCWPCKVCPAQCPASCPKPGICPYQAECPECTPSHDCNDCPSCLPCQTCPCAPKCAKPPVCERCPQCPQCPDLSVCPTCKPPPIPPKPQPNELVDQQWHLIQNVHFREELSIGWSYQRWTNEVQLNFYCHNTAPFHDNCNYQSFLDVYFATYGLNKDDTRTSIWKAQVENAYGATLWNPAIKIAISEYYGYIYPDTIIDGGERQQWFATAVPGYNPTAYTIRNVGSKNYLAARRGADAHPLHEPMMTTVRKENLDEHAYWYIGYHANNPGRYTD